MFGRKLTLILSFAALMLTAIACDEDDNNGGDDTNNVNDTDREFVQQASFGNNAEIELGELAQTNSENDTVREYGEEMVDDHTTFQSALEDIANDVGIEFTDGLSDEDENLRDSLAALSGFEFDSAYISNRITAHENSVTLYEDEINNGTNERLINHANQYLPILQQHLEEADSILLMLSEDESDTTDVEGDTTDTGDSVRIGRIIGF